MKPHVGVTSLVLTLSLILVGCGQTSDSLMDPSSTSEVKPTATVEGTPLPTRPIIAPGELVDYVARSGDTLPALAAHFNTSEAEIREANPSLPASGVTTLPPGLPMRIPMYQLPLMGTPFHILPDSEVPYGPSALEFDLRVEVHSRPGFLSTMTDYAFGRERPAWQVVETVAHNYSIHPRLLLALLEYRSSALSDPFPSERARRLPLAINSSSDRGLYRQLNWAASYLNDGFYGWRSGELREFETVDGYLVRPDSWQNAATVAVQRLFAAMMTKDEFDLAVGPSGFYQTYLQLWGEPFELAIDPIPANLVQPEWALPFEAGKIWDFTGGPHPSWGEGLPWGALDFAPPAAEGGCAPSNEWATAPAPGVVVRSEPATVVLDLDGDGDERTGWVLLYFHLGEQGQIAAGEEVRTGDLLGHPSCEGGIATGTHFHIARRYNGEWLPADWVVPFTMDGWIPLAGDTPYQGTLVRGQQQIPACTCSSSANRILFETGGISDS